MTQQHGLRRPQDIGQALRRTRRASGLTQAQLAEQTGLRQPTISDLEKGVPGTRLQTLFDVLAALDLELTLQSRNRDHPSSIEALFS